jgi:hypothetical protein
MTPRIRYWAPLEAARGSLRARGTDRNVCEHGSQWTPRLPHPLGTSRDADIADRRLRSGDAVQAEHLGARGRVDMHPLS